VELYRRTILVTDESFRKVKQTKRKGEAVSGSVISEASPILCAIEPSASPTRKQSK
jgi:hypothetical protein